MTTIQMPQSPPVPPAPQPKRRRGRTLVMALLIAAVVAVFAAIAFLVWTESKIDRIPASELQSLTPAGDVRNMLVVGTDNRDNLPEDFEGNFGSFDGARTDVIMLAHIVDGRGQLLSIPRDLRVEIPGHGTDKINAAYVYGGPDLLVQTVQDNLGIPVNNYIEVDFLGFANVVDALGGVTMTFDHPVRDLKSGLQLPAGTQELSGPEALAYARSRSLEERRDGEWQSTNGNDIDRTGRQQELLMLMFDQATSPGKAFNLPGFTTAFAEQITADEGLSLGVIAELGRSVLGMRGGDGLEAMTLPVDLATIDGISYVVPNEATQPVIDAFTVGRRFPR
jgi:LCP family protein required for cell wall assembly